ncbi:MAG: hypothetical protein ACREAY_01250 [Nitrososphaera sp.]|uniref:hypothetical protein n=1 Tax=Nitrososphaera sp. TaxID=1971748 RepID=UPI003D6ECBA8
MAKNRRLESLAVIVLSNFEDVSKRLPADFLSQPGMKEDLERWVRHHGYGMMCESGAYFPGSYVQAMLQDAENRGQNMAEYIFSILETHIREKVSAEIKRRYQITELSKEDRQFFHDSLKEDGDSVRYPFQILGSYC